VQPHSNHQDKLMWVSQSPNLPHMTG
jgi:hypothetical protein